METQKQVKIPKQVSKLHGFSIPYDGVTPFDVEVQVNNQTNSSYTKDFISYIGKYDSDKEIFKTLVGWLAQDKTIPTGESTVTINLVANGLGEYDILTAYGNWQGGSHIPPFIIEDGYLIQQAIYVKYFDIYHKSYANQSVEHDYGVSAQPGEEFYLKLEMKNTTNTTKTKDYAFAIGQYDDQTGNFTIEHLFVKQAENVMPGETKTISIPGQSNTSKVYDSFGGYGIYDDSTGNFNFERITNGVKHSIVIL